ncbi:MAG TPA: GFA family protein [Kofleriaceae bacterium]|nr:GFA family protein [Kofleriaceae bacterium]
MKKTFHGSCHCGAVRFEAEIDLAQPTTRCNCRFCTKARFWFAIVPTAELRVLAGGDALVDYQHAAPGKPAPFLHFQFCRACGVRAFTQGGPLGELRDGFYAVNLGCLDDASDAELAAAPVRYLNGRDDDWQHEAAHRFL